MARNFPQTPTMHNLPAVNSRLEKITLSAINPEEEDRLSSQSVLNTSSHLIRGTWPRTHPAKGGREFRPGTSNGSVAWFQANRTSHWRNAEDHAAVGSSRSRSWAEGTRRRSCGAGSENPREEEEAQEGRGSVGALTGFDWTPHSLRGARP